ncbi:DNA mismatch repair protein MutL [Trametes versicolor FP-101664 SS1]|uniref:DNA mismatch repair protein MutL n=1 Tax=Trametes versicolor (strain FP-101664) TaxID=717944 RepID=UPI0004622A19|nr:DNA mismatch repair protein MutL [Trametes versicolor FP-101664 SS1]EIW55636.1 DNA mismatch repair protein MutL [Trametes versicolor FP-101664 SS1]
MVASTSARAPSPPPPGPRPIRRLQESVINRIAAGEIIHRPASALKELIENSLDAGATSIKVTVKEGGMKLLQIQDNGCGIRKEDLPILAERFTTSKLATFADLSRLTTYGFRGEALASISYVSNLTVVTKTKADSCAWKACYADGALTPVKAGASSDPKPCAGNDGTTITVENLFYNTPTRLSALRGSSEEYTRILDVVTRYAVHNPLVSFTCKKTGSPSPDVSTPSSSTTEQAIRLLYGQTLAKELLHVSVSPSSKGKGKASAAQDDASDDEDEDADDSWSAEAHFTNANYQAKKMTFLLFINHRLVEASRIKRALEAVYNGVLAKGAAPFVYLSLQIDPRSVDVNVHPTKKEVHFLDEDAIIERIADVVQDALIGQSQSRVFEYQTLLTGGIAEPASQKSAGKRKARAEDEIAEEGAEGYAASHDSTPGGSQGAPAASQPAKRKVYSQHKIRTSLQERTLDSMFPIAHPSQRTGSGDVDGVVGTPGTPPVLRGKEIKESLCYLKSVKDLRSIVLKQNHYQLSEILAKHTFVGIVDAPRCLSLVQHGTRLYLLNHGALSAELFYQLGLRQFGDLPRIRLDPAPELRTLVALAVDAEEGIAKSGMSKDAVVDRIVNMLLERRAMLQEYFSLGISEDGRVETLPMLLRDYTPNLDKLPLFLMRLGPQVDWTDEQACFDTFLHELASFYVPEPLLPDDARGAKPSADADMDVDVDTDARAADAQTEKATQWQVQHVLFPAMARYLVPPKSLLERDVVQVADLPDLYRVFERC